MTRNQGRPRLISAPPCSLHGGAEIGTPVASLSEAPPSGSDRVDVFRRRARGKRSTADLRCDQWMSHSDGGRDGSPTTDAADDRASGALRAGGAGGGAAHGRLVEGGRSSAGR